MAKFVTCLRSSDGDKGERPPAGQGPKITFLQNLRTAAQNRVAPVPIPRSFQPVRRTQNTWRVQRAPCESGSEQDINVGVIGCADELDGRHSVHNEK